MSAFHLPQRCIPAATLHRLLFSLTKPVPFESNNNFFAPIFVVPIFSNFLTISTNFQRIFSFDDFQLPRSFISCNDAIKHHPTAWNCRRLSALEIDGANVEINHWCALKINDFSLTTEWSSTAIAVSKGESVTFCKHNNNTLWECQHEC